MAVTGGSDSNDGTAGNPWLTISKVNSYTYTPGDQILFNRGDTWREQLTVPSSGDGSTGAGHGPITIGAYGSGVKPIISGADVVTGFTQYTSAPFSCGAGDDNFDCGTTTCGDDLLSQANCNETWAANTCTGTGALITNAGVGLEDGINKGKVLTAASGANCSSQTAFTAVDTKSMQFLFNVGSIYYNASCAGQSAIAQVLINGGATLCGVGVNQKTGKFAAYSNNAWQDDSAISLIQGTTYIAWIDFTKNSATGCTVTVAPYTGGVVTKASGTVIGPYQTANNQADTTKLRSNANTAATCIDSPITFDRVRQATTAFGDYDPGSGPTNVYYKTGVTTQPKVAMSDAVILPPTGSSTTYLGTTTTTTATGYWDWKASTGEGSNVLYIHLADGSAPSGHTIELGKRDNAIYSNAKTYLTVDGLELQGSNSYAWYADGASSYGILQNSTIKNSHGGFANSTTATGHFTLNNNQLGPTIEQPIFMYRTSGKTDTVVITNNNVGPTQYGGSSNTNNAYLVGITNLTITGNYFHDPWTSDLVNYSGHHEHNIYSDGCDTATVARNIFYNSDSAGIKIDNQGALGASGWNIYDNIFWKNGCLGAISMFNLANTIAIYNNTFYGGKYPTGLPAGGVCGPAATALLIDNGGSGYAHDVTIKNNIFSGWTYSGGNASQTVGIWGGANNVLDYNLYYYQSTGYSNPFVTWHGTGYTLADLYTNTGMEQHGIANVNPNFVNITTGDFHLLPNSPAINAGVNVGLTSDYEGRRVPQGARVDIGAYEFPLSNFTFDAP